jgi:hypothetical protein
LAEQRIRQVVVGRAEVPMVEEVEGPAPETKRHLLGKAKLPLKRDISLPSSKTPQYIASEIAQLPGGRLSKGCWVESFASRILRPIEHKRPAQITARPEAKISRSSSGFRSWSAQSA